MYDIYICTYVYIYLCTCACTHEPMMLLTITFCDNPQLDNQLASRVYSTPLYTEVCNKPDSPEQAGIYSIFYYNIPTMVAGVGETWFLDAGVLLKKDRNGIVTRLELVVFF